MRFVLGNTKPNGPIIAALELSDRPPCRGAAGWIGAIVVIDDLIDLVISVK